MQAFPCKDVQIGAALGSLAAGLAFFVAGALSA
jgi:hypothetical protein